MSVCAACGQDKGTRQDRLCSVCRKAYNQAYYLRRQEDIKANARRWREANPERKRELDRAYRAANQDRISRYKQEWWRKHRDEVIARWRAEHAANPAKRKAWALARYWSNPDRFRAEKRRDYWKHREQRATYAAERYARTRHEYIARVQRWQRANWDKVRTYKHRNKVKRRGAEGSYTAQEWQALCGVFGACCLACGATESVTVDHVIPLARGGTNYIENLQPLCGSCNSSKGTKIIDYRNPVLLSRFFDLVLVDTSTPPMLY